MFKEVHVFRVRPGDEVLDSVAGYCRGHDITSAVVLGIIGSVRRARLNFLYELPGKYETIEFGGPLEICSGQGSIATKDGELVVHIHVQLSGRTSSPGGHLVEGVVFSTAEVALGELSRQLLRRADAFTGLNELAE